MRLFGPRTLNNNVVIFLIEFTNKSVQYLILDFILFFNFFKHLGCLDQRLTKKKTKNSVKIKKKKLYFKKGNAMYNAHHFSLFSKN